jgi:hypothetical protein
MDCSNGRTLVTRNSISISAVLFPYYNLDVQIKMVSRSAIHNLGVK